ncbi:endonuclease/exonuclease/phosphatase family protein [Actinocorallia longicatena]|uniref:Endonuclease/exonuclease/phosphatase domain-containing protein n=1 Tax=Actinocorallia longicatena TaxID=111803 RepID=A0ABP6QPZ6_9ACTN
MLAETLRFSLAEFSGLGVGAAAGLGLLAAAIPFLAPLIRSAAGPRALMAVGVGGLLAARLAAQILGPDVAIAVAGTGLGLLALTSLYEGSRGLSGVGFTIAATAGLAVDTSVRMAFGTWDPVWRSGVAPWAVCLLTVALGGVALFREVSSGAVPAPRISWRDALGAAALGPFLALQVLVLSSPPFVASSGWLSLTVAHLVVLAGQALALGFLASGLAVRAVPGGLAVLGGTLLGVCAGSVAGSYALTGKAVVFAVIPAQVLAAWLLAVACRSPLRRGRFIVPEQRENAQVSGVYGVFGRPQSAWRIDIGAAIGGIAVLVILLPYTLNTVHPLPFPNNALTALAGILLGLLAAIGAARGGPLPARAPQRAVAAIAGSLALLGGTAVFVVTEPAVRNAGSGADLRIVSLNLEQAMHGGRLDPEAYARRILAQDPDVVLLQEVGRGATSSGGADLGVWLSRRLGMSLVWGPATDAQYGNAILTSRGVMASGTSRVITGDQIRGYAWARIIVRNGPVDVWTTRFADGPGDAAIRATEGAAIVRDWSNAPHTVVAGDLGAQPGSDELSTLTDGTGLRRVSGTTERGRTDGLFGSLDMLFSDVTLEPGLLAITAKAAR